MTQFGLEGMDNVSFLSYLHQCRRQRLFSAYKGFHIYEPLNNYWHRDSTTWPLAV